MTVQPRLATSPRTPISPSTPSRLAVPATARRAAIGAGALAFLGLASLARRPQPNRLDVAITTRLQRRKSPAFARLMKLISSSGYAPFTHSVVLSVAANFWTVGRYRDAVFTVGTMGAGSTTGLIKILVGRPRPDLRFRRHHRTFKDNSFPSGHATHYMAFYGYVFYLGRRYLPAGPLRMALLTYCATLIALVGPSRIYLGHHWASDVLAGEVVGFTYLMAMLQVYEALDPAPPVGWERA